MHNIHVIKTGNFGFDHVGWKYNNLIKKKAMEQEFSFTGLIISLSIAFFIVLSTAFFLSLLTKSVTQAQAESVIYESNIYKLESNEFLHTKLTVFSKQA